MTLRLVGSEPPRPKRRKYERSPTFSRDEERRFRQALRNLQGAYGSWRCLMDALNIRHSALADVMRGKARVSGDLVVKAMRASGLGLKDLIGEPVAVSRCRACGGARRAA